MDSFQLGDNEEEDKDDEEPKAKKAKLSADAKKNKKYGAIWMVPHLVKHLRLVSCPGNTIVA